MQSHSGKDPAGGPDPAAVKAFASAVRGKVIDPSDKAYESARKVYNATIDRRPALIVRCADVADVIACVGFAREHSMPLAIRAGSHSVPGFGTCDGGVVADLSPMKGIRVDPARRVARVQTGCTWGDFDHATHPFGLATPGGVISTTGVSGLTLGGGFGYLTRRYGLSCDNLISADVVTADGSLLTASATERPDLYWALRGGGGNFGVVTSMEFRLHPVSTVFAGPILYPLDRAAGVLRLFRDFMAKAPREVSAFFAFLIVPSAPPFPEPLHGKTVCGIVFVYCGDPAAGESAARPLLEFGPLAFAHLGPAPYPAVQSMFDPLLPPGLHHYWKADFVNELTDEVIAAHVKYGPDIPTINSALHIYPLDGAVHDVAPVDTAFSYRRVRFTHIIAGVSPDPAPMPTYRDWVRTYWSALHPLSAGGAYVNFLMDDEDEERIVASYRENFSRLAKVKKKYDPGNLFRVNQNIKPAAT
ncbi:MAG: FAD-binding oxidoreductase [Candidatus Binataceae bacterium]